MPVDETAIIILCGIGIPHSEKEAKKASVIQQLSPQEIEGLKVACRVSLGRATTGALVQSCLPVAGARGAGCRGPGRTAWSDYR